MTYRIALAEAAAATVLEVRRTVRAGNAGDDIGAGMRELFASADRLGLVPTGPPTVTYHGRFTDTPSVEVVFGLPVGPDITDSTSRMVITETEPRTYASTIHSGEYRRMADAYRALDEWMLASGLVPAGPASEVYLIGPDAALCPEDLRTEIRIPVVARSHRSAHLASTVGVAVESLRHALLAHGFLVLSEVDLDAALGADGLGRPHLLLTACVPALARRVLDLDPSLDRLLHCVFTVRDDRGSTVVEACEPACDVSGRAELVTVDRELRTRVAAVVGSLPQTTPPRSSR